MSDSNIKISKKDQKPPEISSISLSQEMKKSYLDYAMSVIVSRALPDVRDGLKPVHRRILYSMNESGYHYNKSFKKSARIVGDVMGKYHPHGDSAIYDSMVRMAQNFSMSVQLIDGQGNFGSMDGDPPAAMRYTEARLTKIAEKLLKDIEKDTVSFQPNYDDSTIEPTVLPSQYPNLLVNGAGGIAVGMATQIAPHNLSEVIDATLHLIKNPEATIEDLNQLILGPDFPTGGQIIGKQGILEAFKTGRGSCIIRSKTSIEDIKNKRQALIVNEIPFQVNKSRLIEKIAEVVNNKTVEGISDIRDESDRKGVRIVIELKREVDPDIIKNQLFKHTLLQTTFNSNMLALNQGKPEQLNLKEIISSFILFREEIVTKRSVFELNKAKNRSHILLGFVVANDNLDQILDIIKNSKDSKIAKENLKKNNWKISNDNINFIKLIDDNINQLSNNNYKFSEEQAKSILELRLHRLTGLEREDIKNDLKNIVLDIKNLNEILNSRPKLLSVITNELDEIKKEFSFKRRTEIIDQEYEQVDEINYIQQEDIVITVSHNGYIKRSSLEKYKSQNRGGKGKSGMSTREDDFVKQVFITNTHTKLLVFSSLGKVYSLKSYDIPDSNLKSRGKPIINLLKFSSNEKIATILPLPINEEDWNNLFLLFLTKRGMVRKNKLIDVAKSGKRELRETGKLSIKLKDKDELIGVSSANESEDVLISTTDGKCLRFSVKSLRLFSGLNSGGVRGIKMDKSNYVVSLSILKHSYIDINIRQEYLKFASEYRKNESKINKNDKYNELQKNEEFILSLTSNGYGKRSSCYEYRISSRGGKGIIGLLSTNKNGKIIDSFIVNNDDQIILVSEKGQIIRVSVNQIRIAGRSTQGVSIFKIPKEDKIVSVSRISDLDVG